MADSNTTAPTNDPLAALNEIAGAAGRACRIVGDALKERDEDNEKLRRWVIDLQSQRDMAGAVLKPSGPPDPTATVVNDVASDISDHFDEPPRLEAELRTERTRMVCIIDEAVEVLDCVRRALQQWEFFRMYGDEWVDGSQENASYKLVRELLSAVHHGEQLQTFGEQLHGRTLRQLQGAGYDPGPAPHSPLWPDVQR